MNLKIAYPDDFPLRGFERDMFETKLRDALRVIFAGNAIRQLAQRLDARRAPARTDALPLREIGNEHAFEECMAVDCCRLDDMPAPLRRNLLRNISARLGLTLSEWDESASPSLDEPDSPVRQARATNGPPPEIPDIHARHPARTSRVLLAVGLCAVVAIGGLTWKSTRAAAPLTATIVSTSPAQTLRELASSVPADHRPYRVTVQVEPQDTGTTPR